LNLDICGPLPERKAADLQDFRFANLLEEEIMPAAVIFIKKAHPKNSRAGYFDRSGSAVNPFFASVQSPPPPRVFVFLVGRIPFGAQNTIH
jgi:hypothetical protein